MGSEYRIRLIAFAAGFAVLAAWELLAPRRRLTAGRRPRWPGNFGVLVLGTIAMRLLSPIAAVGAAVLAEERSWGLFSHLAWPRWIEATLAFVALDLAIYAQHVAFHATPCLWRLHRMHHADTDLDLSTGVRFHPLEFLLSLAIKVAVVLAFGMPYVAVLVFEVVLNATSMFSHANIALPHRLERVTRWIVVTPRMHQVHHSTETRETNSNFGFNLPWWDRLFGTYLQAPMAGEDRLEIGLSVFRSPAELRLDHMLTQPFRTPCSSLPDAPLAEVQPVPSRIVCP